MRVMIAGGGTGGHVFPSIALGEELLSSCQEVVLRFARLIPEKGWDFVSMKVDRLKGQSLWARIKTLFTMPKVLLEARRIIKKFNPSVVVGVGGYASGPILLMAAFKGLKTLVMEQNSIPGITNRILGKFVSLVCVTFPESAKFFSSKKVHVTGNPVRREMLQVKEKSSPDSKKVIFCFGGSQGAKALNDAMLGALPYWSKKREEIRIVHQIGKQGDVEEFKKRYDENGVEASVHKFIDDMGEIYAEADLVICRAGATSVSELMVCGKPALLVPYPYAADNHQEFNARSLEKGGGTKVVLNKDLTGELLVKEIDELMSSSGCLEEMSLAMKKMAKPDAASVIAKEVAKLNKCHPREGGDPAESSGSSGQARG